MPTRKLHGKSPRGRKTVRTVRKKPLKAKTTPWLWIWLVFTGVAMLSATAGAMLAVSLSSTPLSQTQLTAAEEAVFERGGKIASGNLQLPKLTRPVNILVLGIKVLTSDLDEPPDEDLGYHALVNSFEGLSDTMLLLRFDPQQEKLTVLSIPRDTKTYVEGYGVTKINAANYEGGPALSAKAISELLNGVSIDRYVRVNVQGIEKLVDALGGVSVYVPKDMKYTDHSQHLYIDLKEGQQHLDGDQVMQFLRFRYDQYGDVGRVQRQQILMRALVEQALSPATLTRLPAILKVIQSHIDTNLTVEELFALVGFGAQTKRSNVQMLMVPGEFNGTGQRETSYWIPNRRRIRQLMATHFDQGYNDFWNFDPRSLQVAIQDSTGEPRAVESLVDTLKEIGFRQTYVVEPWSEPLQVTRIIAQQGDESSAALIRDELGFGEIRVESTGSISSDVTIQLGQDWLQQHDSFEQDFFQDEYSEF